MDTSFFSQIYGKMFPFWESLNENDRNYICGSSVLRSYKKGEHLHDGNECTGVIIVKSGNLRVYIISDEGKEITLYRLFTGEMCMLSASCVLQSITFDVFVDAEENSECCIISGSAFATVSERQPFVKIFALETALNRFSDVMWVMQQILFMSFDRRLAIFLSDEISKSGTDTVTLTHEQIAKYIGSAREVVSRMLKYFTSEGITEVSRRGIRIIDKKKLRALTR